MKAEHRKELQTNALADRMGRMVQRVKTGPSRRSVLWIVLAVLVVVIYVGLTIYWNGKRATMSGLWAEVGDGHLTMRAKEGIALSPWIAEYQGTNPALAARYQIAWTILWEQGLKRMAADPARALDSITNAEKTFAALGEECKDDPVLAPESAYALAVIEESRAVEDRANLDKAIARYKAVQSKYKDSAAAKAAAERVDYLEKNRGPVEDFYAFMNQHLSLFGMRQPMEPPPPSPVPVKEPEKK